MKTIIFDINKIRTSICIPVFVDSVEYKKGACGRCSIYFGSVSFRGKTIRNNVAQTKWTVQQALENEMRWQKWNK